IDSTVAGGFGAAQRTAPIQLLAGQHAVVVAGQAFVLAEHVADLAAADADVTGRYVGGRADVAIKLVHERLAEAHDLVVGLTLGVEVATALAATDSEAGQRVLEDLFETEELDNAGIDAGVEAQATLVRADGGVVLNAVAL